MNLAIVKLSSLGDVLHALPVARALRRAVPEARITWIVESREQAVLLGHPDLDAVLAVDSRRWRRMVRRPRSLPALGAEVSAFREQLRAAACDVALDLQGLLKSGVITAWTRAPLRIGFARAWCREPLAALFTTRRVAPPPSARHVVEQYLSLLGALGVTPGPPEFHVPPRPEAERRMEEFLGERGVKRGERLVALNPGAARAEKRWPLSHFRALAEALGTEAGCRVLVLWGPDEAHMAREIATGLSHRALLAPPTDLAELAALLRRASLVVAGDTGPLHLAAAVGTPALGLYGPTRAERNGPWGPRCRALQSPDGTLAGLTPERVLKDAQEMLGA